MAAVKIAARPMQHQNGDVALLWLGGGEGQNAMKFGGRFPCLGFGGCWEEPEWDVGRLASPRHRIQELIGWRIGLSIDYRRIARECGGTLTCPLGDCNVS